MLCLEKNEQEWADIFLLSDYQFASNGDWKATTGGNRWGWIETNIDMTYYGQIWNPIDYWIAKYGDLKVLYIGIVLEYWAVEPDGYGEPLYVAPPKPIRKDTQKVITESTSAEKLLTKKHRDRVIMAAEKINKAVKTIGVAYDLFFVRILMFLAVLV